MSKNKYPITEKLDDNPRDKTVIKTPVRVTIIPVTCLLLGFSFKSKLDAIREAIGIEARKIPLSEAVV